MKTSKKSTIYRELDGNVAFWTVIGMLGAVIAVGLGAAYYMEHHGHYVTGMSNQIVWGIPHIFAIFLIVAASGALNVASVGTVFNKTLYKPMGRFSALMAATLLIGGLSILVLDLGRPDRLIVAMTSYNFKSIFAWNIILYNGFLAVLIMYLWFMMERKMNAYYPYAGFAAFIWRLILTTGTGSIFGFLVSRAAYDTAILAPLFISLSLSLGTAFFLITLMAVSKMSNRELGDGVIRRLSRLLGVFVALTFYFVVVYHLSNAYLAKQIAFETFILFTGNPYPMLLWFGFGIVGTLLPLLLIYLPKFDRTSEFSALASFLVMLGAFCLLYVIIIGGQAFPLEIFPGKEVLESSFGDANKIHPYVPTIWEILLGFAGIGIALIAAFLASWVLPFFPETLANTAVDPHLK